MNSDYRGRFITFEGGEGVGKSTQAIELRKFLEGRDIDVVLTREPGGSPGAEDIRHLLVTGGTDKWQPMTETLLHYAARAEHLQATILPALKRGAWVICDRYADSTLAYQGYGQGQDIEKILELHKLVTGDFWPDLTLLLDGGVKLGLNRARHREDLEDRSTREDRYERMGEEFHQTLRKSFLDIAKKNPDRIVVIEAEGGIDSVAARIAKTVTQRLLGE
ncbi:dTMP kinase [Emcibacter nanhaiensis]|uniref:Thymidylate kinase n=1 Tax=Emcibacter nanhaiensis TaxID=1505037 RepID=A0A501PTE3_9PROT|nr:dTMP kinase [Emcibacter nanhaiensis]TPD63026.1 dTMP kinase [Emcibacter nanhaiensis]